MLRSDQAPRLAVVFPGQGSQRPGMARDFFDRSGGARRTFEEASDVLGLDVAALCFEDDPRLDQTEHTQPAILTAEIAMLRALGEAHDLAPAIFGGHSLGEYTALVAAGVLPLDVALRIVRRRGALMQDAVPIGEGAMAAIKAPNILERGLEAILAGLEVAIANENSRDQVVLSGRPGAIEEACRRFAFTGDLPEIVPLKVSAPFHSPLMREIEPAFRGALADVASQFSPGPAERVVSNLTGAFHLPDTGEIIDALTRQVSSPVRWVANMEALAATADRIVEIGPSCPLRVFFKTLGFEVTAISSVRAAERGLRS